MNNFYPGSLTDYIMYGLSSNTYYFLSYALVVIGAVISLAAQIRVKATFSRYSRVLSSMGLTAQDAAGRILLGAGIGDVEISRIRGSLTDHYSPREKVLRLSDSVYGSTSVAAIGVAAHECGHAIQHHEGYGPLKLRSASVPIANIGSRLSWPVIIIGLAIGSTPLAQFGVWLFVAVVFFQLITLPVEFDASRRALRILEGTHLLSDREMVGARRTLRSAAMTYVAALFSAILQLLRLVMIVGQRRRD